MIQLKYKNDRLDARLNSDYKLISLLDFAEAKYKKID